MAMSSAGSPGRPKHRESRRCKTRPTRSEELDDISSPGPEASRMSSMNVDCPLVDGSSRVARSVPRSDRVMPTERSRRRRHQLDHAHSNPARRPMLQASSPSRDGHYRNSARLDTLGFVVVARLLVVSILPEIVAAGDIACQPYCIVRFTPSDRSIAPPRGPSGMYADSNSWPQHASPQQASSTIRSARTRECPPSPQGSRSLVHRRACPILSAFSGTDVKRDVWPRPCELPNQVDAKP